MLQAWFQLLDMGLTPMLSRETARYNVGRTDAVSFRQLVRALEYIFFVTAILGGAVLVISSHNIATNWLRVESLSIDDVRTSVVLMSLAVTLRWIGGLYRGIITGFEKFVWLSNFNALAATAKFVLVLPVLIHVSAAPKVFFAYQLGIAVLETGLLLWKAYELRPALKANEAASRGLRPLRGVLRFSLSIAFTSSVWVLVTQSDKLILSKILSLSQYAYFTLGVLVASGVSVLSGPISGALLPRIAKLSAMDDDKELLLLYRKATQLVAFVVVPVAAVLALFSEQLLWAWTGDQIVAAQAAPVLSLYAAGNGILALAAFPYYLQYGKGDMKLHLIGSCLFVLVLVPTLIALTTTYGVTGAGYAWLGANLCYFLLWTPLVHRRFFKNFHTEWILRDVAPPVFLAIITATLIRSVGISASTRATAWCMLLLTGVVVMLVTAAGSSHVRSLVRGRFFNEHNSRL